MKKSIKQMVGKRIVSVILSALLAVTGVGLLPQLAVPVQAADYTYNIGDGSVSATYDQDCTVEITGTSTTDDIHITVEAGRTVTVTLNNVNVDVSSFPAYSAFGVSGDGNVVIILVGINILKSGEERAGLEKDSTGTLTITGTGSLYATGGEYGAGIGGADYDSASNIEIAGGTIFAYGGYEGAGIGGGGFGDGTNISITDGMVTAIGGDQGAGIGGGGYGDGTNIEIIGGTVKAIGGLFAAGIGSGEFGNGTNISISGDAVVYAIGGEAGAGIGAGFANGSGGTASGISISESAIVSVAGGADHYNPYFGSHFGAGAAIGLGGQNNSAPGDELVPDTTNLTTGRIIYYPAGTSLAAIIGGSSSAPLPVDCMQEVMDDINAAIVLGGEQTVTIRGYSALSSDVMELLAKNPQITVVSEFSFDGLDYKITIPGSAVKLNPAIEWYGPKYLFPMFCMYGTDTEPAMQAFLEKYAEEIR